MSASALKTLSNSRLEIRPVTVRLAGAGSVTQSRSR
jgi:hypothetical protein